MQQDIFVSDFEQIITLRVCATQLKDNETKTIIEKLPLHIMSLKFAIVANALLRDLDMDNILETIFRGKKAFIIFKPTGRIAAEICIDGIYDGSIVRQPRAILMNRRGYCKMKTIRDLADFTARQGNPRHNDRRRYA